MTTKQNVDENFLSEEWVELVKEAMRSNITKEDFKKFLEEEKKKRHEYLGDL